MKNVLRAQREVRESQIGGLKISDCLLIPASVLSVPDYINVIEDRRTPTIYLSVYHVLYPLRVALREQLITVQIRDHRKSAFGSKGPTHLLRSLLHLSPALLGLLARPDNHPDDKAYEEGWYQEYKTHNEQREKLCH
jgi:hypothetical protein